MKRIPSEDSSEYEAFGLEEWRKVRDGVTIGGVYISGWLYWHINHWKIQIDGPDNTRPTVTPPLRDNEWMIAEALERAEKDKQMLCMLGCRQSGKTTYSSSYLGRKGTIIVNSQNLIIGASRPDLANITNDLDFGLQNVTPFFRIPRITRDWKSPEVLLGVKTKEGDNQIHSMFRIRNTEGGINTEVTAGARASSALIDEIGKGKITGVIEALKPALRGKDGWRAPILLTGTGGDMEKGKDAEIMFFNPESNDCVDYIDEVTGKKTGLFMPGWLRMDFKQDSTLGDYLGSNSRLLKKIPMMVSNKELAIETLKKERLIASKDPDPSKLIKRIMYDPLAIDEIFLTENFNIFPKDLLLEQKELLATNPPPVDNVELYRDSDNRIRHKFSDKKAIRNFPIQQEDNKEGVIQIWEMPLDQVPNGIYIAATDPYKQSQAEYSDSVGSTYIFKRTYDIANDRMQNSIVAAYHGRPKRIQTWYENTKMLLEFYNAKTLCENMDYGFIQHLIDKNEASQRLVKTPKFLWDIHPNTTVGDKREYGIHMTKEIKNYLHISILEYITAVVKTEKDDETGETRDVLGVRKIPDIMLIEELLKFGPDINADRIVSFGLVVGYSKSLDRIPLRSQKDTRLIEASRPYKKNIKSPFGGAPNPFRKL